MRRRRCDAGEVFAVAFVLVFLPAVVGGALVESVKMERTRWRNGWR